MPEPRAVKALPPLLWLLVLLAFVPPLRAAEQHRATRLGQRETRFAPPMHHEEDLRARFREPRLKPDFAEVLRQWGWEGDPEDLHRAGLSNAVTAVEIPVGATMPFMSSRQDGKPVCLRNVLWAGKEPIEAYAFTFTSKGRRYRCVIPRPCSNFFLEDLGPEPRHALALVCRAPAEALAGHPVEVCLTVRNEGNVPAAAFPVMLPIPAGATVGTITADGDAAGGALKWIVPSLAPGEVRELCATLAGTRPGRLAFAAQAVAAPAPAVAAACETVIRGVPAVLLEVIDLEDPVEVGREVNYEIRVTNQGTAPLTAVRLVATLDAAQEFVSVTGRTPGTAADSAVTLEPVPVLEPQETATWRLVAKAARELDARLLVELRSAEIERPVVEMESTQQY